MPDLPESGVVPVAGRDIAACVDDGADTPMACSAACSKPRKALSHAVNNPSEGAFSAGSSSASRSRRRNDDGVCQIFMPEKSSRSRASSTFRRRLSMAQQVLATRSACSSSGSAPPASPSRSRVTSCRRNAATPGRGRRAVRRLAGGRELVGRRRLFGYARARAIRPRRAGREDRTPDVLHPADMAEDIKTTMAHVAETTLPPERQPLRPDGIPDLDLPEFVVVRSSAMAMIVSAVVSSRATVRPFGWPAISHTRRKRSVRRAAASFRHRVLQPWAHRRVVSVSRRGGARLAIDQRRLLGHAPARAVPRITPSTVRARPTVDLDALRHTAAIYACA